MPLKNKRLRIMAGPNGSGKSTILQEVRKTFFSGPFVNADEIEKTLNEKRIINLPSLYNLVLEDEAFSNYLLNEGDSWVQKAERIIASFITNNTALSSGLFNRSRKIREKAGAVRSTVAVYYLIYQLNTKIQLARKANNCADMGTCYFLGRRNFLDGYGRVVLNRFYTSAEAYFKHLAMDGNFNFIY